MVSSRVIDTPREVPSRQEVIRRESTDERSKQRNRRMFGALLGTLQKFRQEETKLKAKVTIFLIINILIILVNKMAYKIYKRFLYNSVHIVHLLVHVSWV